RGYSGLIPANLITLPHLSVSSAISLPKSADEPGRSDAPRSVNRVLIVGSASMALIAPLSLPTISVVVPPGAASDQRQIRHNLTWCRCRHRQWADLAFFDERQRRRQIVEH